MNGKSATPSAEGWHAKRASGAPFAVPGGLLNRNGHGSSGSPPAWIWGLGGLGAIFVSVLGGYMLGVSTSEAPQRPIAAASAPGKSDVSVSAEAGKGICIILLYLEHELHVRCGACLTGCWVCCDHDNTVECILETRRIFTTCQHRSGRLGRPPPEGRSRYSENAMPAGSRTVRRAPSGSGR